MYAEAGANTRTVNKYWRTINYFKGVESDGHPEEKCGCFWAGVVGQPWRLFRTEHLYSIAIRANQGQTLNRADRLAFSQLRQLRTAHFAHFQNHSLQNCFMSWKERKV
jgi:hypothetical protein